MAKNKSKLAAKLAPDASPLNYYTTLRVIRDAAAALDKAPVISCEGANTMDNARCAPEQRLTPTHVPLLQYQKC